MTINSARTASPPCVDAATPFLRKLVGDGSITLRRSDDNSSASFASIEEAVKALALRPGVETSVPLLHLPA
jgi:hypothetical protein